MQVNSEFEKDFPKETFNYIDNPAYIRLHPGLPTPSDALDALFNPENPLISDHIPQLTEVYVGPEQTISILISNLMMGGEDGAFNAAVPKSAFFGRGMSKRSYYGRAKSDDKLEGRRFQNVLEYLGRTIEGQKPAFVCLQESSEGLEAALSMRLQKIPGYSFDGNNNKKNGNNNVYNNEKYDLIEIPPKPLKDILRIPLSPESIKTYKEKQGGGKTFIIFNVHAPFAESAQKKEETIKTIVIRTHAEN
jgi:hypothetical protein